MNICEEEEPDILYKPNVRNYRGEENNAATHPVGLPDPRTENQPDITRHNNR